MGESENSCFVSPIEQTTSTKWQSAVFSFKEDVDTGRNAGTSTREEVEEVEEAEVAAVVVTTVEAAVAIIVEALLSPTEVVEVGLAVFHNNLWVVWL